MCCINLQPSFSQFSNPSLVEVIVAWLKEIVERISELVLIVELLASHETLERPEQVIVRRRDVRAIRRLWKYTPTKNSIHEVFWFSRFMRFCVILEKIYLPRLSEERPYIRVQFLPNFVHVFDINIWSKSLPGPKQFAVENAGRAPVDTQHLLLSMNVPFRYPFCESSPLQPLPLQHPPIVVYPCLIVGNNVVEWKATVTMFAEQVTTWPRSFPLDFIRHIVGNLSLLQPSSSGFF